MEYTIENEILQVTVKQKGAELASVAIKETGEERIWQADPKVWPRHAPLLFPYCGKLFNQTMQAKGQNYPATQHGFARDMDFALVEHQPDKILLRLQASPQTLEVYPYDFVLEVGFTLQGNLLVQQVTVKNPGEESLPFAVGFHPGFALPFGERQNAQPYTVVFEQPESPVQIKTPGGYVNGEREVLFEEKSSLPLTDDIFVNDSLCLQGLASSHVALRNQQGQGVKVGVEGFPYVLLWGPPSGPLPFMCIEPWHGLPDGPAEYGEFAQKPGITNLAPGGRWETALEMEFT